MPDRDLPEQISRRLDEIIDPCSAAATPMGLIEMGLVDSIDISDNGDVQVRLRLTSPFCHMIGFLKSETISKLEGLEGVNHVTCEADAGLDWSPTMISSRAQARRNRQLARMRPPTSGAPEAR
jgi:metal-sulfur cluster biosynthetic enzyme